jgi:hypothetical protein
MTRVSATELAFLRQELAKPVVRIDKDALILALRRVLRELEEVTEKKEGACPEDP